MARRRSLTFGGYVRRRWRLVGLTLVAVAGTLLFLVLTDHGHEPLWRERTGAVETLAVSPDGTTTLAVVTTNGRVTALRAFDAATGEALWSESVNATSPAAVASGDGWFAVATPIPGAQVTAYAARDGTALFVEYLDAEPRAVAADGDRLAVALRSGGILVFDEFAPVRQLVAPPLVSAFDAQGGRIVAGTADGRLVVWEGKNEVLNVTRPLQIQSVRLSVDGTRLAVSGRAAGTSFSGLVEYYDLAGAQADAPAWSTETRARVSFVDMDRSGDIVLGVEESAPRYALHAWSAAGHGEELWPPYLVDGAIAHDDPGRTGGAALSTDGRFIAVAPDLGGPISLVDARTGRTLWSYDADGASAIAFPEQTGGNRFVASARVVQNRGHDTLLGFDTTREPVYADFARFAPALVALELVTGAAALGIGYWWYRRN